MITRSYGLQLDDPAGFDIVGCGNILGRYVRGLSRFPQVRVVGCSGRPEREG
jgi:hypothetical protein